MLNVYGEKNLYFLHAEVNTKPPKLEDQINLIPVSEQVLLTCIFHVMLKRKI